MSVTVLHEDGHEIELDEEWLADTHDEMKRAGHPERNLMKLRQVKDKHGKLYAHSSDVTVAEGDTKTVRWAYREEP